MIVIMPCLKLIFTLQREHEILERFQRLRKKSVLKHEIYSFQFSPLYATEAIGEEFSRLTQTATHEEKKLYKLLVALNFTSRG